MESPNHLSGLTDADQKLPTGKEQSPQAASMDYIEEDVHCCVISGDIGRLMTFLKKGLSVNHVFRSTDFPDRLGKTLLEIAVHERQKDVIETLVNKGSNANLTYTVDVNRLGCVIKPYRKADRLKLSVMYKCVVQGDVDIIRYLVRGGFDVNVYDDRGCSALWHAVDSDNYEMVKAMLSAEGSDVNAPDKTELRPLHIAALHGNAQILALLLRHGAKVDVTQLRGSTPLILACRKGNFQTVKYLLLNGANPNHMGNNGHTALSSALQGMTDSRIIPALTDSGARVTPAILQACREENPTAFKMFPDTFMDLLELSSKPQTLKMLCSLVVRYCVMSSPVGTDLLTKSLHLPLPTSLRDYITLNHLCST